MPSARTLTDRLRRLAPEAFAFAVIGAANTALYLAITWVALPIGAVKATVNPAVWQAFGTAKGGEIISADAL